MTRKVDREALFAGTTTILTSALHFAGGDEWSGVRGGTLLILGVACAWLALHWPQEPR